MAAPNNPHDADFRQVFGQPRPMAVLLRIVLPAPINALLDLDPARLRFLDPTHVDPELRGTASDLIVEVPRREARGSPANSAIFVFAVEHQRRYERFIVFRQRTDCVRIWERWLRDRLRGAGADTVSKTLLEILQAATRPEADELFEQWTARLAPLRDEPAGVSTLVAALWYLLNVSAVPDPRIVAASEALPEPARDSFMTGAEQLMQRGLERGLIKGREEGRQEGEHAALAYIVLRQARQRFGEVPPEAAERIEASSKAELERYIDAILTAERLADLFG